MNFHNSTMFMSQQPNNSYQLPPLLPPPLPLAYASAPNHPGHAIPYPINTIPSTHPTTTTTTTIVPPNNNTLTLRGSPPYFDHLPHFKHVLPPISLPIVPPLVPELHPVEVNDQKVRKTKTPRKKRQCPECHLFFSNLATHKSTHLSVMARPHLCPTCHRGFARPNDLIRHKKRHLQDLGENGYKCPFYSFDNKEQGPEKSTTPKCHSKGVFSRCDTYKNHLKALHFEYPTGTKKKDRSSVAGHCKSCYQRFNTLDEWLTNHIEKGQCPNMHLENLHK